jgi:hypothetical protein
MALRSIAAGESSERATRPRSVGLVQLQQQARDRWPDEALREAITMALYVTLVLATEFTALGHEPATRSVALGVIWGTAVGLTAIHVFAFGLAARLVARGHLTHEGRVAAVLQVVASLSIAALVSLPFLVVPMATATEAAGWIIAAVLGSTAYAMSRTAGGSHGRSFLTGLVVLGIASLLVALKVLLSSY